MRVESAASIIGEDMGMKESGMLGFSYMET